MTSHSQALIDWLAGREAAMTALLRDLVDTDSGTHDKAGVDAAGAALEAFWRAHGLTTSRSARDGFGDILFADLPAPDATDQRPVLLLGHRDTVFPKGEARRRPFHVEGRRGYGPGVADMKSGLVVEAFVLAAFKAVGGAPAPLRMMTTSDEEIASPACRDEIMAQARRARATFNAEPSRRVGDAPEHARTQVVTRQRKGGVFLRADARGKAAHSGAHYDRGRSAILDLAQKVAPLHALTDLDLGVSVNVGLIGGGQTVNTVAPNAFIEIDLRYVEPAQRAPAIEAIRAIVETPAVEGVASALTIKGEFLPLTQDAAARRLLDAYIAAGARLGVTVTAEMTGGCADSGLTAAVGCPTLCSLGPCGGGGHTPQEFVELDSLVPAAQTLALTILRIAAEA